MRERLAQILRRALDAETVDFTVSLSEATMAQVHFVVRPRKGELLPEIDPEALEHELAEAARNWRDDLDAALSTAYGEAEGPALSRTFLTAFPEAYKEDYDASVAAQDVRRLSRLGDADLDLSLSRAGEQGEGRLKVFRTGEADVALRRAARPVLDGRAGHRRTHLRARGTGAPDVGLRLRAALHRRHRRGGRRAVHRDPPGDLDRATTEVDGFNRAGPAEPG